MSRYTIVLPQSIILGLMGMCKTRKIPFIPQSPRQGLKNFGPYIHSPCMQRLTLNVKTIRVIQADIGQLPRVSGEDPERIRVDSVFETFVCLFFVCLSVSKFSPFLYYKVLQCSTVQYGHVTVLWTVRGGRGWGGGTFDAK